MIFFLQALLSTLAWVGMTAVTVGWTGLITVAYAVHPWLDPDRRVCHRLAACWGRTLIRVASLRRVELSGQERIPSVGPVIFVANHQSYVDVPLLFRVPAQFKWMADDELFRIPVFGWSMRMAGYIPVHRGDGRQAVRSLEKAKEWLARGISIFAFPEGTRSRTGVLGRFQTGAFRIAIQTRTPVVPVVVVGSRQLLPRNSWIFRWGVRLKIRVLTPIRIGESTTPRELAQQVKQKIREEYARQIRTFR